MDYPKSVPNVGLVNGKFVDENTTTGQVGSLIPATWGSAVTDEILNVIMGGGYVPDENENGQLLQAIKEIIADNIPPEKVRTTLAEYGITDAYTKAVTYTKEEIEAKLKNLSALPVGAMVPFPRGTVPAGFLEANGDSFNPDTYPDLAAYLGGNTLPDTRGEFLRGWDHGRGVDAGRAIASIQLDSLQGFRVESMRGKAGTSWGNDDGGAGDPAWGPPMGSATQGTRPRNLTGAFVSDGVNGTPRIGSETRARNLAVMWCIKVWNAPVNQGNIDVAALEAEVARMRSLVITTTHKKLFVSSTGVSAVVSLKAEKLIIGNGAATKAVTQVDLSVNMTASGLGGLDTGVVAASSCYGIWVASNGANTAAIAALMPVLQGALTLGSPVITGLASTASMRAGMQFSSAFFPWGVTIKSIDSASQITASQSALATVAADNLRFVYEPILPAGYVASRFSALFTDATASKFPLAYTQVDKWILYRPGAGTNIVNLPLLASGVQGATAQPPTFVPVAVGALVPPTASKVKFTVWGHVGNTSVIAAPNPGHYGITSVPAGASPLHISDSAAAHNAETGEITIERGYMYYASGATYSGLACNGYEDNI
ncbi:phage tail protein [Pseudomonas sp. S5D5]|uniref:phage tail protein n=1 Tax=Pseudomonas sp. S5D5 TaxID=2083056 RepID=UPI000D10B43B|nr:phage tail protein [Pseudomonas sp. S5D5]